MNSTVIIPGFPASVREFFCQRLIAQQNASDRTVASYRDMFGSCSTSSPITGAGLRRRSLWTDLDAPAVLAFLDHLERERGNSIPTRNVRLAALRSFLKYAAAR